MAPQEKCSVFLDRFSEKELLGPYPLKMSPQDTDKELDCTLGVFLTRDAL